MHTFNKAKNFIYKNARPLDFARWQYHFENGSADAVLNALAAYQNDDGGFGHALEPDCWNPNSAPLQTWTATEILREINFTDANHPIIQGILKYLASGKSFNRYTWYGAILSNNDYPHAFWWGADSESINIENISANDYNPTACLAGFIVKFADKSSDLYKLGCSIVTKAYELYMAQDLLNDCHTANCFIRMMEYCEGADIIDTEKLKEKLILQVTVNITKDKVSWLTDYICTPSFFFKTKDSIFYLPNKELADYECEFIVSTQLDDGSWNIPWSWGGYEEQWSLSKNWWKANGAILNMLYLKNIK